MYGAIIVDDEEDIRYLIRRLLEDSGRNIEVVGEAADGEKGLSLCAKLRPDMVFTDIRMPGLDGLEMLHEVKKVSPDTEVVLISGYSYFSYAQKAIDQGAAAYLLKPVEEEQLYEVIDRIRSLVTKKKRARKEKKWMESELKKLQGGLQQEIPLKISTEIAHEQIQKAVCYIHENYCSDITLESVAGKVFMNTSYFSVLFKKLLGVSFSAYINKLRMEKAKQLLFMNRFKVAEIAHMTGFRDVGYFNRMFKKFYGQTPTAYRQSLKSP